MSRAPDPNLNPNPNPKTNQVLGSAKLHVFVNNEEDKNEELMEISLAFTDIARAAASSREAAAATAS